MDEEGQRDGDASGKWGADWRGEAAKAFKTAGVEPGPPGRGGEKGAAARPAVAPYQKAGERKRRARWSRPFGRTAGLAGGKKRAMVAGTMAGEMAEWPNAPVLKTGSRASGTGVRIPLSPKIWAGNPEGGKKLKKIVQLGVDTYMPLPVSSLTVEEDSTKKTDRRFKKQTKTEKSQ